MIPLKVWNSLPAYKRRKIVKLVYQGIDDSFLEELSQEYHHNFEYNSTGSMLKSILQCCYINVDNTIKVKVTFFV